MTVSGEEGEVEDEADVKGCWSEDGEGGGSVKTLSGRR